MAASKRTKGKDTADQGASSIDRRRRQARRDPSSDYIERRQKLLTAAAEVFKEKGLEAASVNDIAERLGSDRASVYYYFGGKHEIFMALVQQAVEHNVVVAESIANSTEPSTLRLRRLIEGLLYSYEREYPFIHLYIQEDMRRLSRDGGPGNELWELSRRFEAAIAKITKEGVESGEFRPDIDSRLAMFAILGAVNWTHRWFAPGGRLTGAEVGREFADLFLRGVSAQADRE
jgi:TetR/AcrR family transcriptional regulator, cholesterol catabolism regulator